MDDIRPKSIEKIKILSNIQKEKESGTNSIISDMSNLANIRQYKKHISLNRLLSMIKSMPKPLYMGKDLVKLGYKPSEKFKSILDTLYKMQLSGEIC